MMPMQIVSYLFLVVGGDALLLLRCVGHARRNQNK